MSEQEALLQALESDPIKESRWLVYADWLEEEGDSLASTLRATLENGKWSHCRFELFSKLRPRKQQLLACDCVERLLPFYERRYPTDRRPRQLIETLRRYATGKRVGVAEVAVAETCKSAASDARSEPKRFLVAFRAAQMASWITEMPSLACLNAAYAQVAGRFGPDVLLTDPNDSKFKPKWRAAIQAEFRWQIARLLRYRSGSL